VWTALMAVRLNLEQCNKVM